MSLIAYSVSYIREPPTHHSLPGEDKMTTGYTYYPPQRGLFLPQYFLFTVFLLLHYVV